MFLEMMNFKEFQLTNFDTQKGMLFYILHLLWSKTNSLGKNLLNIWRYV